MSNHLKCYLCSKKIAHSARIQYCSLCRQSCHTLCIPGVSKFDPIYNEGFVNWYCTSCNSTTFPFNHLVIDSEFLNAISEMWAVTCNLSLEELNEKIFIPFELNSDANNPLFDTDPDINYFDKINGNVLNSDYYLEDSFNSRCQDIPRDSFSLIHMNIRSAPKHLDEFTCYIDSLDIPFTVIGLSETWLKESNADLYNIDGYNTERNIRIDKMGGGVSLYIKMHIQYIVRDDLSYTLPIVESKFVEINKECVQFNKNVVVGIIYRPPNTDAQEFSAHISDILHKIRSENKLCYLIGDFNLNLLNCESHSPTAEFVEMMYSYMFFPLINKPTRVTHSSATIIDNIFTNDIEHQDFLPGILFTDISDHFPIFVIQKNKLCQGPETSQFKRIYSTAKILKFKEELGHLSWTDVLDSTDPQEAYTLFFTKLSQLYDSYFPLRRCKLTYYNRKPWPTDILKNAIKKKNDLRYKITNLKAYYLEPYYKEYKCILQKALRAAEKKTL